LLTHTHTQTHSLTFIYKCKNSKPKGGYTQTTKARKPYVIELRVLIFVYVLSIASRASVTVVQGVPKMVSRIPKVSLAHKNKDSSYECKSKNTEFSW
jgi:archaellum biogenesis protein FlaJ (TadC family)